MSIPYFSSQIFSTKYNVTLYYPNDYKSMRITKFAEPMVVKGIVYIRLTPTISIYYRFSMEHLTANKDKFQKYNNMVFTFNTRVSKLTWNNVDSHGKAQPRYNFFVI